VILGIAAFLMLLAATGFQGIQDWHEWQAANRSVGHSRQVIETLDRVRAYIAELETEKRRYTLTPDLTYLNPYGASEEGARREIEALQNLVADDPLQSLRAAHLAPIVAAKLREVNEILNTAGTSRLEAELAIIRSMDEIRSQIDQMLDIERLLLAHWQARVDGLQQSTIWLIAAAVVIATIFAGAAFALAWLEVIRRREATDENTRLYSDLQERQEKIRRLVDSNIIGILIADLDGRILEANDAFLDMVGYSREDLISGQMRWIEMTPPEWHAATQRAVALLQATGTCEPFEKEYFRKDGSRVPVLNGAAALEGSRNESVAFVLDLTERKQAEGRQKLLLDERERAEYLTGQVFESAPDGISILGKDYRYQRVNPIYEHYWGMPAKRMIGMHVADLLRMDVFEQTIKPNLDRCFAGEEVSYAEWFTSSLGRRYLAVTYSPLRPHAEWVEAALVITHDLTEHMLAAEALRQAQAELAHVNRVATMGQLTASIAHEVNQPIAAAVTNAQAALRWLGAQSPDVEEVRQALGRIVRDGNRAGAVIGRIRALIKKAPPRKDSLEINEAILEVLALTRGEVLRHGVLVQTQLAEGLPLVEGDRVQLQQVILNLILNAVEAMSSVSEGSRELLISTTQAGSDSVLARVRDSGPGLDPDSVDRLFEAFYTTKPGGMGMGLSICRSIIEAHGGRLWATANGSGGAVFQFTLPLERDDSVPAEHIDQIPIV
jgi:PAS domain S-box-containing protein